MYKFYPRVENHLSELMAFSANLLQKYIAKYKGNVCVKL